jgi:hypothetical protein
MLWFKEGDFMSEVKTPIRSLNGHALVDEQARMAVNSISEDKADKKDIPAPYALPTASAEVKGGVKVGGGLKINDGILAVKQDSEKMEETIITVEEDDGLSAIILDGKKYSAVHVLCVTQAAEVSGVVRLTFESGAMILNRGYIDKGVNITSGLSWRSSCYQMCGVWQTLQYQPVNKGSATVEQTIAMYPMISANEHPYVDKITITATEPMPKNTQVVIRGVIADA